jgi:hypothetical protein
VEWVKVLISAPGLSRQTKHISHWKCIDRHRNKKVVSGNVFFTIGIITITNPTSFGQVQA